jgi:hypothetical protein
MLTTTKQHNTTINWLKVLSNFTVFLFFSIVSCFSFFDLRSLITLLGIFKLNSVSILSTDRYLYQMLEKSKSYEEREEWTQKIIDLYTKILELLPGMYQNR